MEDNNATNVSAEEHEIQQQTTPVQDRPAPSWKEMLLLYVAIGIVAIFGIFAVKSLDKAEVKPSEILTNPGAHSLLEQEVYDE